MKKLKNFLWLLNPKNLQVEISAYGYVFSFKSMAIYWSLMVLGSVIGCTFLGLSWAYTLAFVAVCICVFPVAILFTYRTMFEQKRFTDTANYVEQVLYGFKRKSKIKSALEDVIKLFPEKNSRIHQVIDESITIIESKRSSGVYKVALDHIEKDFGCKPVAMSHNFMRSVEEHGGEYYNSLNILIDNRSKWMERITMAQADKRQVRRNLTISICLAVAIMSMSVMMLPDSLTGIINASISQATTLFCLILNVMVWLIVNAKLSGSWMESTDNQAYIMKLANQVKNPKKINPVKQGLVVAMGGIIAVGLYLATGSLLQGMIGVMLGGVCYAQPYMVAKTRRKNYIREVEKAFPDWMLSLSLLLQTDTVHVAIAKSVDEAPYILQEELHKLMDGVEENPTGIEPFIGFFSEFGLVEITSAMKILYSMSQYGSKGMEKQVETLVERNGAMLDKAERLRSEDLIASLQTFVYLPMLIAGLKMMVDMGVLLFSVLATNMGGL